uniref:Uncharacterized protein LOC111132188 isoform X2 n=1 Tax=Crassostrea virginica TaxID=6565 RepID=A0A8B8E7M4_CRAVI|nr:uncharacterized protein LOC111132188 isoform X2 [Crassostrea virginica]
MKIVTIPILVLLAVHPGTAQQQYHTWSRTWTTNPGGGGGAGRFFGRFFDFNQLFRQLINNFPSATNFKMMFSNPPPSTRGPTAPRPNYTPQVTQQRPAKEVRIDNTPLPQQPSEPQGKTLPQTLMCTPEYKKLPGHTMCMKDKPNVSKQGMTEAEKLAVLDQHNRLRGGVNPPAMDLVKLEWDERLAAVAQKWANQCEAGHDKERNVPSIGMSIGQNVAGGYRSWEQAVQMWWDEIDMWTYGVDPDSYLGPGGWKKIGHFTQMAQNGTYLVGCGYAVCDGSRFTRYYVCDYAAGQSNLAIPYTKGPRCSRCPGFCRKGQCDCGGRVCYNGGTLNLDTCQCECQKLYKGPTCEELNCPAEDKWVCGRDWTPLYCKRFVNVPFDCPYMCGKCSTGGGAPAANNDVETATQSSFISKDGCEYKGKRSSPEECRAYGANGTDIQQCSSMGGSISCVDCDRFFNVKRDMCPVMCGLCDPPCKGKKCENGGKLNVDTCKCTCEAPYIGARCEQVDCSKPDKEHCAAWPNNYCDKYHNVPQDCPMKCGLCY